MYLAMQRFRMLERKKKKKNPFIDCKVKKQPTLQKKKKLYKKSYKKKK